MPLEELGEPVKAKPMIYKGKPVDINLPAGTDYQIGRAMYWTDGHMHRAIVDMAREIAQAEDDATLDQVRDALDQLVDWMEAILQGDSPAPEAESPLVDILQRLDGLETRVRRLETASARPPRPQLLQR